MKYIYSFLFFIPFVFVFGKDKAKLSYDGIRKNYENYAENDISAFAFINPYIQKAKKEKKYPELFQAYRDAVFYSKSNSRKITYADSCLDAAYKSGSDDRVATAYVLKGSVYYAKMRSYKAALDEFLMAYKYSKNTGDLYLKYKIAYHLGVVKNYLGYYDEALELFKPSIAFFESESKNKNLHHFQIFNNRKGYLNSLHQIIICYRNKGNYEKADSLINIGLRQTFNNRDFVQERSYFLKCKGLLEYHNNNYQAAINYLQQSLSLMKNDFAWAAVDFLYIGKSHLALGNEHLAITNFKKIDSIFEKSNFILPEIRENYELLINYYKDKNDAKNQLFYTTQLLKADSLISQDFAYLSPKVHREYDTTTLLDEKGKLEKANSWGIFFIILLLLSTVFLAVILYKKYQKEKIILQKYALLQKKLQNQDYILENRFSNDKIQDRKTVHVAETLKKILLEKLKKFEENKDFNQKGLTIQKLAAQLETNSIYLSQVIKEYRGMTFNKYVTNLRIRNITYLLYEKRIYLNYTIESLAKECGIASRQNFSDLFYEINGIRPTDFIRKRKKQLENKADNESLKDVPGLLPDN